MTEIRCVRHLKWEATKTRSCKPSQDPTARKACQNLRIISDAFTFAVISVTEKQQMKTGFDHNQAPFINKELRKKFTTGVG